MALLDEGPRSATARAVEPTSLLEISRSDFKVLLDQAPLLAYAMMRVLSSRLRGTGALMVAQLQHKNRELADAYRATITAVVNTLEAATPTPAVTPGGSPRSPRPSPPAWACPRRTSSSSRSGPSCTTWARSG